MSRPVANRELDALVVEHITGGWFTTRKNGHYRWLCCYEMVGNFSMIAANMDLPVGDSGSGAIPLYSTDPAASKQIRDKMRADGWMYSIHAYPIRNGFAVQFWKYDNYPTFKGPADTEELAVAIAALAAVGHPVESNYQEERIMSDILSAEQVQNIMMWIEDLIRYGSHLPVERKPWIEHLCRSHEDLRAERDVAIQRAEASISLDQLQRHNDLILHQRSSLLEAGLISQFEFDEMGNDRAKALRHLEGYDALSYTISAQAKEIRMLRDEMEKIIPFIRHRECEAEFCYDWCPLCCVESALAATPQPTSATVAENATVKPPPYNTQFPLWCATCRSSLTFDAFGDAGGQCPVCGNGTVRDLTPSEPASAEVDRG